MLHGKEGSVRHEIAEGDPVLRRCKGISRAVMYVKYVFLSIKINNILQE